MRKKETSVETALRFREQLCLGNDRRPGSDVVNWLLAVYVADQNTATNGDDPVRLADIVTARVVAEGIRREVEDATQLHSGTISKARRRRVKMLRTICTELAISESRLIGERLDSRLCILG